MVDGNIILFGVFAFYGFFFLLISTIITWFLSKKYPSLWLVNKTVVAFYLILTIPVFCGVLWQRYYDTTLNGKFSKAFGSRPNTEVLKDLQVVSVNEGELEQENFFFSTDKESFKKLVSNCFYEISEQEASNRFMSYNSLYLKNFIGKSKVVYYERPDHDIDETHCLSDGSNVLVTYDEETGNAYCQWNFIHF